MMGSPERKWRSVAKVYADVNLSRPPSFWDYPNAQFEFRTCDDYMLLRKIGRGKYSEVFHGFNKVNGKPCAIKVLKPIKKAKIKRELLILQALSGGDNIIQLLDMVKDPTTTTVCFVFEYVDNVPFETLYPSFKDMDIRYYMYELLKALDFCHSQGIMHRDVKPHNVMIDPRKKQLRLIDWGLAEFYHKGMEYNVRVASRFFKAPELLLGLRDYDYSLDLWGVGCMLAALIFMKEPFFPGTDLEDQLVKITQVLGSDGLQKYLEKYELRLHPKFDGLLGNHSRKPWRKFIKDRNRARCPDESLALLDLLLQYDHQLRPSAKEAMQHPYFDPIRQYWAEQKSSAHPSSTSTTSPSPTSHSSTSSSSSESSSISSTSSSTIASSRNSAVMDHEATDSDNVHTEGRDLSHKTPGTLTQSGDIVSVGFLMTEKQVVEDHT
eukprot:g63722.t1